MHHSFRAVRRAAAPVVLALSLVTLAFTFPAAASTSRVAASPPIVLTPLTLPKATGAVSYSQQLSASGGSGGPYTFSHRPFSGQLPPGLTLSTTGLLSGVPTQAGGFSFAVRATDPAGKSGSHSYSIKVLPGMSVTATGVNGISDTFQGQLSGGDTVAVQPRFVGPVKSVNGSALLPGLVNFSISIGSVPSGGHPVYLGTVSVAAPDGTIVVTLTNQAGSVVRTGAASMSGHFVGAGTVKGLASPSATLDVRIVAAT